MSWSGKTACGRASVQPPDGRWCRFNDRKPSQTRKAVTGRCLFPVSPSGRYESPEGRQTPLLFQAGFSLVRLRLCLPRKGGKPRIRRQWNPRHKPCRENAEEPLLDRKQPITSVHHLSRSPQDSPWEGSGHTPRCSLPAVSRQREQARRPRSSLQHRC